MRFVFHKNFKRFRIFYKVSSALRNVIFLINGPYGSKVLPLPFESSLHPFFEVSNIKGGFKTFSQELYTTISGLFKPFGKKIIIFGTGYKAYCPRVFQRKALVFRVGFGGAEIASKLPLNVKARARKQRLILTSPFYDLFTSTVKNILNLKRPDPYKAKGIRLPGNVYNVKPGKIRANR